MRAVVPLLILSSALILASCETAGPSGPVATRPPVRGPAPQPFRAQDFAWSIPAGAARINGRLAPAHSAPAFTCGVVVLVPDTPWSRERMTILYRSTNGAALPSAEVQARSPAAPPQLNTYVRQERCDAAGRFTFERLPNGIWYVITSARPANGGPAIALMRRVQTAGGRTTNVDL
jgi:hypothetical protein